MEPDMSIASVYSKRALSDFGRWLKQRSWVQWFLHWPNLYEYWMFKDDPPNRIKKKR